MSEHVIVPVTGLSCASCVSRLEKGLNKRESVQAASVNLGLETLDIKLDSPKALAELPTWIEQTGFGTQTDEALLTVQNVTCAACTARIEKVLAKLPGVQQVSANLATNQVQISWVAGVATLNAIKERLSAINYPVIEESHASDEHTEHSRNTLLWHSVIGLGLSAPMIISMFLTMLGWNAMLPAWVQWALTTPIQFWLGLRFYRGAFSALKHGGANMDVLVALGTSAAYGYSLYLWLVLGTHHLYFEATAVVMSLVLLGKWMEARAKHTTSNAIRKLMNLQPPTAKVWDGNALVEKPVTDLAIGQELQVQPGDTVPADGVIVQGTTTVDEAMLTGESIPITKSKDEAVFAGTQNLDGSVRVRVHQSPEKFRLQQIVSLVNDAQMQKPDVQKLVDKISAIFVPVVMAIALLTFGLQAMFASVDAAFAAAISVLVIACPCALGLATPTAIMAASGVGARRGVLVRDINQLHLLNNAHVIAFDKTGTLTQGSPKVVHTENWHATEAQLDLIKQIQQQSQHPLARAIVNALSNSNTAQHEIEFENQSGKGVIARTSDATIRIGNATLLSEEKIALEPRHWENIADNATPVWVSFDDTVVARFDCADEIRAASAPLVQWLKTHNWATWLLTGDRREVSLTVQQSLELDDQLAQLLPEHKASAIEQLRKKFGTVVMVGDGINDAPALAKADVSIAMGNGTDVAMEAAGITLMRPDIQLVAEAIQLAKKTTQKIRQNLFWAFIYNCVGIPLAALGFLNPMIAGAAMAFSSVSVVSSSLVLLNWNPKEITNHEH